MKNDLISRDEAIDAINDLPDCQNGYSDTYDKACIIGVIEELPSAKPERKKGKWIQNDNGTYSCSLCQSWIPKEQHYYAQFCLYCGAYMRGEQDE